MEQQVALDMYMTAGVGVVALLLGMFFTRVAPLLKRLCIPTPVSGGLAISLLTLVLHSVFKVDILFDGTIKDICMMLFFTSVGYQSNLKVLKQGGKPLAVLVGLMVLLVIMQNLLSVGISKGMGLDPLVGMATGSIPMAGGHGTAGGFSSILQDMGLTGAPSIMMAAATFGLVAGSLIGGPIAEFLVRKHKLAEESGSSDVVITIESGDAAHDNKDGHLTHEERMFRRYSLAAFQLFLAMALGMCLSKVLALTGITFPTYFGALIMAAIIRNFSEFCGGKCQSGLAIDKIIFLGNICLSLFLGMAMATLKLWELSGLMLPLVAILCAQALFMAIFARFIAFPALGKNYDAAVLVSGICGFGLGATPNAMANMSAVCYKYHYAVNPFIIVPIVGAMFVDLINTGVISFFLNII